jgi:hypothetical protein
VVDSITKAQKIEIPEEMKYEFSATDKWPTVRYHGDMDILLGENDQNIQPQSLEVRKNLGIFQSSLSATTILGGRHEKIFSTKIELSQVCKWMKRNVTQSVKEINHREALTSGKRKTYQTAREGFFFFFKF